MLGEVPDVSCAEEAVRALKRARAVNALDVQHQLGRRIVRVRAIGAAPPSEQQIISLVQRVLGHFVAVALGFDENGMLANVFSHFGLVVGRENAVLGAAFVESE